MAADLMQICLEQQDTIARQSETITLLLSELAVLRAVGEEEKRLEASHQNGGTD